MKNCFFRLIKNNKIVGYKFTKYFSYENMYSTLYVNHDKDLVLLESYHDSEINKINYDHFDIGIDINGNIWYEHDKFITNDGTDINGMLLYNNMRGFRFKFEKEWQLGISWDADYIWFKYLIKTGNKYE